MASSREAGWATPTPGLKTSASSVNPAMPEGRGRGLWAEAGRKENREKLSRMSGIIPPTASLEHITMSGRTPAVGVGAAAGAACVLPLVAAQLPASDEAAKAALDKSPRHGEWVGVFDGLQNTRTFIVHPQRDGRSPFVIVVSDNRGMSDW